MTHVRYAVANTLRMITANLGIMILQSDCLTRACQRFMLLLAVLLAAPTHAAELAPLQMGLLPYLSSDQLFKNFLPMKNYLEVQLNRRIEMSTAPNFKTYVQRAAHGDYDIYQTAPHFALLAETESGYHRVSRFMRELDGSVVVRNDSTVKRIEDLRGRTVITPDALAITSMLGEQLLKDHGLMSGRDYQLDRSISHNNAILTVFNGGADAALTSAAVFEHLDAEYKRELKILTKTRTVPHMMIMANPRLTPAEFQKLKSALLAFKSNGAGRNFFEATGYGDMGPITDADMAQLRPFIKATQEQLQ